MVGWETLVSTLKSSNKWRRAPPLKKGPSEAQSEAQFGDHFWENYKTILNLNSKFLGKIPSPKKDMKKRHVFWDLFRGGPPPFVAGF